MSEYRIRRASLQDQDFLLETIIAAEKSGSDKNSLQHLFGISEEDCKKYILLMLDEEIEGCEFNPESFLLAEKDGMPVAAVAAWIENFEDAGKADQLRSNLIGYTYPREAMEHAKQYGQLWKDLDVQRADGTLQIEYVYVHEEHRGHALAGKLIAEHVKQSKELLPTLDRMQVQLYANNLKAQRAYEKEGFVVSSRFETNYPSAKDVLADNAIILMEKNI